MDKKIKEIINKYQYDRNIKKYSNKHFHKDHSIWRKISSNKDVERKYRYVYGMIDTYNKIYPLETADIIDLERALGEYEIAVSKVLNCYDIPQCKFSYSPEQLQNLIDKISEFWGKIKEIDFRKTCQ